MIFFLILVFHLSLGDIAPLELLAEGGASFFSDEQRIQMSEYHIEVVIDLSRSTTTNKFIYVMENLHDEDININCFVPYIFGEYNFDWLIPDWVDLEFEAYIDTTRLETEDFDDLKIINVTIPGYIDSEVPVWGGYAMNLTFPATSTHNFTFIITNEDAYGYVANFRYLYSAETCRYWGQELVEVGSFSYEHKSEFYEFTDVVTPSTDDETIIDEEERTVESYITNIDPYSMDLTYEIIVDTGVEYEHEDFDDDDDDEDEEIDGYPNYIISLCLFLFNLLGFFW